MSRWCLRYGCAGVELPARAGRGRRAGRSTGADVVVHAGTPIGMQPLPDIDSHRLLIVELDDEEVDVLLGLLSSAAEVQVVARIATALDANVRRPARAVLPEHELIRLPHAGRWVAGPGVRAALVAQDAAVRAGAYDTEVWKAAAGAVARDLATAVLAGARGTGARPLARLHRALEREADASR